MNEFTRIIIAIITPLIINFIIELIGFPRNDYYRGYIAGGLAMFIIFLVVN